MSNTEKRKFQKIVWDFYKNNKRDLPWRRTKNPYFVLVSEVMLQQTQVSRVLEKYPESIKAFPTVKALADAGLVDVLSVWQGMGYNRRAKYLKQMAEYVKVNHKGIMPKSREELIALPGVGQSTAGAVMAFAYNKPSVFIETNIRRVFIHHFFSQKKKVDDKEILKLVEKTVDLENPREWYYALFDYGTYLAKEFPNPNRRSKHYTKQSKFEGSQRQTRAAILKYLIHNDGATEKDIEKSFKKSPHNISSILEILVKEGFVEKVKEKYCIKK